MLDYARIPAKTILGLAVALFFSYGFYQVFAALQNLAVARPIAQ